MGGERGPGSEGEAGAIYTIDEAIEYLRQGFRRQQAFLEREYRQMLRLGETIHNAYMEYTAPEGEADND